MKIIKIIWKVILSIAALYLLFVITVIFFAGLTSIEQLSFVPDGAALIISFLAGYCTLLGMYTTYENVKSEKEKREERKNLKQ